LLVTTDEKGGNMSKQTAATKVTDELSIAKATSFSDITTSEQSSANNS
jgi:hypothetical protein